VTTKKINITTSAAAATATIVAPSPGPTDTRRVSSTATCLCRCIADGLGVTVFPSGTDVGDTPRVRVGERVLVPGGPDMLVLSLEEGETDRVAEMVTLGTALIEAVVLGRTSRRTNCLDGSGALSSSGPTTGTSDTDRTRACPLPEVTLTTRMRSPGS
jgi:hypothetical protein